MLSASIVFFREWTALKPLARAQELELCKMLVTSSESQQMCLTISVSVAQWHLLNNLTKSQIHIKVTILLSRNIWLWGIHPQEYMMSCQGQISPPYPKAWTQSHGGACRCRFGCWRSIRRPEKGTWVQGEKTLESLGLEGYPSCCLCSQFMWLWEEWRETPKWEAVRNGHPVPMRWTRSGAWMVLPPL